MQLYCGIDLHSNNSVVSLMERKGAERKGERKGAGGIFI